MVLAQEVVLEIMNRAKGVSGEGVSPFENEASVREEVNRRTCAAGYTDRDGQLRSAGKGDTPRPCNMEKYRENYVKIFGHD